eukprot:GHVN01024248.1.p1 GENE.GHVN01024248.1~~GHVN01024248.1.p1  ORF type:complete len:1732 (-),score=167.98 GHVN01024248.1:134-5329(-)
MRILVIWVSLLLATSVVGDDKFHEQTPTCPDDFYFWKGRCEKKEEVPYQKVCPKGAVSESGRCVLIRSGQLDCPLDYELIGNQCVLSEEAPKIQTCPRGSPHDGVCTITIETPPICREPSFLGAQGQCALITPPDLVCEGESKPVAGHCVTAKKVEPIAICANDSEPVDDLCETTVTFSKKCPISTIDEGDTCTRYTQPINTCSEDYSLEDGICRLLRKKKPTLVCESGEILNENRCTVRVEVQLRPQCLSGKLLGDNCIKRSHQPPSYRCPDRFELQKKTCVKNYVYDCSEEIHDVECEEKTPVDPKKTASGLWRRLFEAQRGPKQKYKTAEFARRIHGAPLPLCQKVLRHIPKMCDAQITADAEPYCEEGQFRENKCEAIAKFPPEYVCNAEVDAAGNCYTQSTSDIILACDPEYNLVHGICIYEDAIPPEQVCPEGWTDIRGDITFPGDPQMPDREAEVRQLQPEGSKGAILEILVAQDLRRGDVVGLPDPYAVLDWDGTMYVSRVIDGSQDPRWKAWFHLPLSTEGAMHKPLSIAVYDKDKVSIDDLLGMVDTEVTLESLATPECKWVPLFDQDSSVSGTICMKSYFVNEGVVTPPLQWNKLHHPLSNTYPNHLASLTNSHSLTAQPRMLQPPRGRSPAGGRPPPGARPPRTRFVVNFTINRGRGLGSPFGVPPSTQAFYYYGNRNGATQIVPLNRNPSWRASFRFPFNRSEDAITVVIYDYQRGLSPVRLGRRRVQLSGITGNRCVFLRLRSANSQYPGEVCLKAQITRVGGGGGRMPEDDGSPNYGLLTNLQWWQYGEGVTPGEINQALNTLELDGGGEQQYSEILKSEEGVALPTRQVVTQEGMYFAALKIHSGIVGDGTDNNAAFQVVLTLPNKRNVETTPTKLPLNEVKVNWDEYFEFDWNSAVDWEMVMIGILVDGVRVDEATVPMMSIPSPSAGCGDLTLDGGATVCVSAELTFVDQTDDSDDWTTRRYKSLPTKFGGDSLSVMRLDEDGVVDKQSLTLRLFIVKAQNIKVHSSGDRTYAIFTRDDVVYRTPFSESGNDPEWNRVFLFPFSEMGADYVTLSVHDERGSSLGRTSVFLDQALPVDVCRWEALVKEGENVGEICVRSDVVSRTLQSASLTSRFVADESVISRVIDTEDRVIDVNPLFNDDENEAAIQQTPQNEPSNRLVEQRAVALNVELTIVSARNLPFSDSPRNPLPSAFAVVSFNSSRYKTATVMNTRDPEWNQAFNFKYTTDDLVNGRFVIRVVNSGFGNEQNELLGVIRFTSQTAGLLNLPSRRCRFYRLEDRRTGARRQGAVCVKATFSFPDSMRPRPNLDQLALIQSTGYTEWNGGEEYDYPGRIHLEGLEQEWPSLYEAHTSTVDVNSFIPLGLGKVAIPYYVLDLVEGQLRIFPGTTFYIEGMDENILIRTPPTQMGTATGIMDIHRRFFLPQHSSAMRFDLVKGTGQRVGSVVVDFSQLSSTKCTFHYFSDGAGSLCLKGFPGLEIEDGVESQSTQSLEKQNEGFGFLFHQAFKLVSPANGVKTETDRASPLSIQSSGTRRSPGEFSDAGGHQLPCMREFAKVCPPGGCQQTISIPPTPTCPPGFTIQTTPGQTWCYKTSVTEPKRECPIDSEPHLGSLACVSFSHPIVKNITKTFPPNETCPPGYADTGSVCVINKVEDAVLSCAPNQTPAPGLFKCIEIVESEKVCPKGSQLHKGKCWVFRQTKPIYKDTVVLKKSHLHT